MTIERRKYPEQGSIHGTPNHGRQERRLKKRQKMTNMIDWLTDWQTVQPTVEWGSENKWRGVTISLQRGGQMVFILFVNECTIADRRKIFFTR